MRTTTQHGRPCSCSSSLCGRAGPSGVTKSLCHGSPAVGVWRALGDHDRGTAVLEAAVSSTGQLRAA
eukprot:865666-Alexandrium_andersonii.AAC.1